MTSLAGYEFRSEDMERVKRAAKGFLYKCPISKVRGSDWRMGNGQYLRKWMTTALDSKYSKSQKFDDANKAYSKAGDHKLDNSREILKEMVVMGGDISKADDFSPLSLMGVSHVSDVKVEMEAHKGNKYGAPMYGYQKLDYIQEEDVAKEVDALDSKKIGGDTLGYFAQFQGRYQGGHERFDWLDESPRRVSEYDEDNGDHVENEHVQNEWLPKGKGYDPEGFYAGVNGVGFPRHI